MSNYQNSLVLSILGSILLIFGFAGIGLALYLIPQPFSQNNIIYLNLSIVY